MKRKEDIGEPLVRYVVLALTYIVYLLAIEYAVGRGVLSFVSAIADVIAMGALCAAWVFLPTHSDSAPSDDDNAGGGGPTTGDSTA